jgi:hypothetical protein
MDQEETSFPSAPFIEVRYKNKKLKRTDIMHKHDLVSLCQLAFVVQKFLIKDEVYRC